MPRKKKNLLTQSAYAKQRGVTAPRVNHLIAAGVIKLTDGLVDVSQADKAVRDNSDPSRDEHRKMPGRPVDKGGGAGGEYRRAATAERFWSAMLKKMDVEVRKGELVNAKDMERELTILFTTIKTRIRAIAPKISLEVTQLKLAKKPQRILVAEVQELIKKECDEALQELSEWGEKKC
jgi:hypothetical protein